MTRLSWHYQESEEGLMATVTGWGTTSVSKIFLHWCFFILSKNSYLTRLFPVLQGAPLNQT